MLRILVLPRLYFATDPSADDSKFKCRATPKIQGGERVRERQGVSDADTMFERHPQDLRASRYISRLGAGPGPHLTRRAPTILWVSHESEIILAQGPGAIR